MKRNKLVSSEGRLSRSGYLKFFVAPLAALVAVTGVPFMMAPEMVSGPASIVFSLGWVVFASVADALNIRRWHDLGLSGAIYRLGRPFVMLLPLGAFALQFLVPATMAGSGDMGALAFLIGQDLGGWTWQPVPLAMIGITLVGVMGNVAYLSIMPGQKGPNVHGPDPERGASVFAPGETFVQAEGDDPVKRALAEYQARQAKAALPVKAGAAMVTPMRPAPAGGGFGKRRSS